MRRLHEGEVKFKAVRNIMSVYGNTLIYTHYLISCKHFAAWISRQS